MLREDDELFALAFVVEHEAVVLKNGGQFIPLLVCAAVAHGVCHGFQALEGFNFRFQLGNGLGCRCLIRDLLLFFL